MFLGTASGQFLRPAASRLLLSRFRPYPIWVPSDKAAVRFGSRSHRFWVPQQNGAEKGDIFMSYLYVKWNSLGRGCSPAPESRPNGISANTTVSAELLVDLHESRAPCSPARTRILHAGVFPQEKESYVDGVAHSVGDNGNGQITTIQKIDQSQNQTVRALLEDSRKTLVIMRETKEATDKQQTHDPCCARAAAEIGDPIH